MREAELRERIVGAAARRSFHPVGIAAADGGRSGRQHPRRRSWPASAAPTLVVHGKADPLVPFACGEDTARRIPGARLVGIDGMGHDLPPGVVERLLALLMPHFAGRQSSRLSSS